MKNLLLLVYGKIVADPHEQAAIAEMRRMRRRGRSYREIAEAVQKKRRVSVSYVTVKRILSRAAG